MFLFFASENKKNVAQIERTYYEVISDAIEGCFAFNIESDDYIFQMMIPEGVSYNEILNRALGIESKIIKFYTYAANQSSGLMADIPRAFRMVARKREERKLKLQLLIKNES